MTTISAGAALAAVQSILAKEGSEDRRTGQEVRAGRFEAQMKLEEQANEWNRKKAEHDNAVHTVEGLTSVIPVVGNAVGTFLTMEDPNPVWANSLGLATLVAVGAGRKANEHLIEQVTGLPLEKADRGDLADATAAAAAAKTESERAKKAFEDLNDLRQRGSQGLSQATEEFGAALRDLADAVRQVGSGR